MANDTTQTSTRKRFILRRWHIITTLVVVVIVCIVALSSYFVWDRWSRYDDSQEIQGEWYVLGTAVPIKITNDVLDFNADTSYHYELDSTNKTITFKLGNMKGLAHYCFMEDRQVLVIVDGEDFTRWGTAGEDLLVALQEFVDLSSGKIPQYPQGDGIIVLSRTPNKYGWGNYSYTYLNDAQGSNSSSVPHANTNGTGNSDDSSSQNNDRDGQPEPSTTSGDQDISTSPNQNDGQSPNPDEGRPRGDDPFSSISDILMSDQQTSDTSADR